METFFTRDWFVRATDVTHEAYQQWNICNQAIAQNGAIKYPQQACYLPIIGKIQMDTFLLSQLTTGSANKLITGVVNYGSRNVQKKIASRFPDSEQFQDLMVELYIGASHLLNKDSVTPLETLGYPDMKIDFCNSTDGAFIECKHLRSRDSRRVIDVVTKANTQLENTKNDCFGVLIIHVAEPTNTGCTTDSSIPKEVLDVQKCVEALLTGNQNTAINCSIIVWDGFQIMSAFANRTSVFYARRTIRLNHGYPTKTIPPTFKLFNGFTALYYLNWRPA